MQDGQLMKNISLGTSTKKMRKNFSNIKVEWQSITDNIKSGRNLALVKEWSWFCLFEHVLWGEKRGFKICIWICRYIIWK